MLDLRVTHALHWWPVRRKPFRPHARVSSQDLWHLFEDLHIARAGSDYRAHFGRYPVVFLSFKAIKASRFEDCQSALTERIISLGCKSHFAW